MEELSITVMIRIMMYGCYLLTLIMDIARILEAATPCAIHVLALLGITA